MPFSVNVPAFEPPLVPSSALQSYVSTMVAKRASTNSHLLSTLIPLKLRFTATMPAATPLASIGLAALNVCALPEIGGGNRLPAPSV